jgi:hypothetical protein
MPTDKELNQRDAKLVLWLGEAHAKEAELEADLTAHIALTEKAAYKKRLQQHLKGDAGAQAVNRKAHQAARRRGQYGAKRARCPDGDRRGSG